MKTTTTTREYDEQGRMVKETVVEQETRPMPRSVICACVPATFGQPWNYTCCPVHGYRYRQPTVTFVSNTTASPVKVSVDGKQIARIVADVNRHAARRK